MPLFHTAHNSTGTTLPLPLHLPALLCNSSPTLSLAEHDAAKLCLPPPVPLWSSRKRGDRLVDYRVSALTRGRLGGIRGRRSGAAGRGRQARRAIRVRFVRRLW